MIWLLPYDGSPDASFYPGKSLVDLGGADTYAGDGNYDQQKSPYKKSVAVFGSTMPIALRECGPIPDPTQLMSTGTKWLFFNVWTSPYYQSPSNSVFAFAVRLHQQLRDHPRRDARALTFARPRPSGISSTQITNIDRGFSGKRSLTVGGT